MRFERTFDRALRERTAALLRDRLHAIDYLSFVAIEDSPEKAFAAVQDVLGNLAFTTASPGARNAVRLAARAMWWAVRLERGHVLGSSKEFEEATEPAETAIWASLLALYGMAKTDERRRQVSVSKDDRLFLIEDYLADAHGRFLQGTPADQLVGDALEWIRSLGWSLSNERVNALTPWLTAAIKRKPTMKPLDQIATVLGVGGSSHARRIARQRLRLERRGAARTRGGGP